MSSIEHLGAHQFPHPMKLILPSFGGRQSPPSEEPEGGVHHILSLPCSGLGLIMKLDTLPMKAHHADKSDRSMRGQQCCRALTTSWRSNANKIHPCGPSIIHMWESWWAGGWLPLWQNHQSELLRHCWSAMSSWCSGRLRLCIRNSTGGSFRVKSLRAKVNFSIYRPWEGPGLPCSDGPAGPFSQHTGSPSVPSPLVTYWPLWTFRRHCVQVTSHTTIPTIPKGIDGGTQSPAVGFLCIHSFRTSLLSSQEGNSFTCYY
jgi:hypothetical protein